MDPTATPTPSPTPTPDPSTVIHMAALATDQWQYIACAVALVVFVAGVILAVKL